MYRAFGTTSTLAAGFVLGSVALAYATAPAVRINNTVSISYSVDSVSQDAVTAQAGFVVDRKVDMLVADSGSIGDGRPNEAGRHLVFHVTNEGNDSQRLDIDVTATTAGFGGGLSLDTNTDTLGAREYRVYLSTDATLDRGSDTVYDPTGTTLAQTLGAFDSGGTGDEFYVIVDVNIPSDAQNGENVRFSVTATALDGGNAVLVESLGAGLDDAATPANAVDIVFADAAKTTDSDGTDAAEDGKHTDNAQITVASAELTATKAVTIVNDDLNNPFVCASAADPAIDDNLQGAIPGACLEYTITLDNGAAASVNADSVTISDVIQTGISFEAFILPTTGWSATNYDAGSRTITATVDGSLAPGNSAVLKYRVLID